MNSRHAKITNCADCKIILLGQKNPLRVKDELSERFELVSHWAAILFETDRGPVTHMRPLCAECARIRAMAKARAMARRKDKASAN